MAERIMSAIGALSTARENGVRLGVNGSKLILEADREPAGSLLEALSLHKEGVVAILRSDASGWSAPDWQDFYQDRIAVMARDGQFDRGKAERQALEWCITNWLAANPPGRLSDVLCAACGKSVGQIGEDSIPLLAGNASHAWVHHTCVDRWWLKRRGIAIAALAKMGIHERSEQEERKAKM